MNGLDRWYWRCRCKPRLIADIRKGIMSHAETEAWIREKPWVPPSRWRRFRILLAAWIAP